MSVVISGVLDRLQDQVREKLLLSNEFRGIYISPKKGNIHSWMNYFIHTGYDIGIFIFPPIPRVLVSSVPGPVWKQVDLQIQVVENILTNSCNCSCALVAEKIAAYLHLSPVDISPYLGDLHLHDRDAWTYTSDANQSVVNLCFNLCLSMEEIR